MLKLDEAAEGKSVQNPGTMLKFGVYECCLICSYVLGASRKAKVHVNARMLFRVPFFTLPVLYI